MMLSHFAPRFSTLSSEAVHFVAEYLKLPNGFLTGEDLYTYCTVTGMSHADLVVPLVREIKATSVVEALIGHPITRKQKEVTSAIAKTRSPRTVRIDNRIIAYLYPHNPKKPGTRAWRLWELYRLGMTADEFVEVGGRRSALRYDEAHGFIQLATNK
jgi:hypothetical protein